MLYLVDRLGTKLLVTGFRRENMFVSKKYKNTGGHQLYKITKVEDDEIEIVHERYGEKSEDNE